MPVVLRDGMSLRERETLALSAALITVLEEKICRFLSTMHIRC